MKKITVLSIVLLIVLLLSACGGPTPAKTTEAPAQPAATEAPLQPAPTEAPAQPAATEPPASTAKTEVIITLADNTIESSITSFQAGVPYTFVITNTGRHAHNFNINPPVSVAGSVNAAVDAALLVVPQSQLSAGASATVDYTFPAETIGQDLELSCLIRRHYDDGMKLAITVTE